MLRYVCRVIGYMVVIVVVLCLFNTLVLFSDNIIDF